MTEPPLIIVVSSGYHLYREYLLAQVAATARVWLLLGDVPTWERRYVAGYTVVDTLDTDAMVAAVQDLPERAQIRGVLCWDEVRMIQSARLAERLGLPGGHPAANARCRDKHQTRTTLTAAGVTQPASAPVSSASEAHAVAARFGFPVVVKPRALGASLGVSLVTSPADLDKAYLHAREATEDGVPYYELGVLVEEYLDGEEISIDCAISGGRVRPMFVARKLTGFDPHFEEIGHVVAAHDPLLGDDALVEVLHRAHHAVGFTDGITHTEVRLTRAGPTIVEINCRLGGDLIPFVGWVATGIEPGRVAVQVCCGQPPDLVATRQRVAAVHFFYPDGDVVVDRVDVDHRALPGSVDTMGVLARPGQRLVLPPQGHVTSRYGYVVVVGDSAEACLAAAGPARAAFTLRGTAMPGRAL